jgi:cytochrome c553
MVPISSSCLCVVLLSLVLGPMQGTAAQAAELSASSVAVLAGGCANCHGPDGLSSSAIPSLRGQDEARLRARMQDFRAGRAGDATVMTRLMKAYDEAQIVALARWFAAEARP